MNLPLLLEPEQLEAQLDNPSILIIDICGSESYAQIHIPGAVALNYADIVVSKPPINGLLVNTDTFSTILSSIGFTDQHVVAYDREGGGDASRLLWSLEAFGITKFSLLNGGLISWAAEKRPLSAEPVTPEKSNFTATYTGNNVADANYILSKLEDPQVVLLDARTTAEFSGEDVRSARGGHIPGAQLLDWKMCMDETQNYRLKPANILQKMLNKRGITADKEVIAYCQSHHRSSLSCLMLKTLGYKNVRGYHGAWSDWGNRNDTPVATRMEQ